VLDRPLPRFLAAALLLLMPTFLQRTGHMALSAHWLVLFGVVLYGRRSGWPPWVGLAAVASLIHPYLTAMVCALAAASLLKSWRVDGTVGFRPMVAIMVAVLVVVGAGWWTGGMFVYGLDISGGDLGYGAFSANLNALVNPLGTSRFLPALPLADSRQYEGFNYLGLGLLALWVLACVGLITDRSRVVSLRDHWPLVLVLVCLSIFAVSLRVTFCEWQLMRTDAPRILAAPINAFRASGRFLWPLTYAGTLYGFSYLRARAGTRWQVALLAVMLAVQLIDLGPILQRRSSFASEQIVSRLENPAWSLVMARTDRLLTVPPLEAGTQLPYDFLDLNLPLVSRGVPTSAAYVTRVNTAAIDRWTTAFKAELESGRRLEPGTTLVVRASELPAFLAVLPAGWRAG